MPPSSAVDVLPSLRVTVTVRRLSSETSVEIADTGEGIRRDVLPLIFDRFAQGDQSNTRRHRGLGLGLAIARHIVELHGASIEAESDGPGNGATFRIRLPDHPPADPRCAPGTKVLPLGHRTD